MSLANSRSEYSESIPVQPPQLKDSHVRSVALKMFEVAQGIRPVEQLSRLVSPGVTNQLLLLRALHTDMQAIYQQPSRVVPIPGRVFSSAHNESKVYCVVGMHGEFRSYAISVTYEHLHTGWRVTEVEMI